MPLVLLLLVLGSTVLTVVFSLDLLLNPLHVLDSRVPGLFRHLRLLVEPCKVRLAVAAAETVPERGELAVVIAASAS